MTKIYEVRVDRQPRKIIRKLPKDLGARIYRAMAALVTVPRPTGCKKLKGQDDLYRIRVGGWRITYAILDDQLVILVVEVSPRGGAYRSLTR